MEWNGMEWIMEDARYPASLSYPETIKTFNLLYTSVPDFAVVELVRCRFLSLACCFSSLLDM